MAQEQAGKISLIAVDLDGTLLTSEGILAPEGARLLKKAVRDGIHVVLATTRNPDSVVLFCRSLEINQPLICTNGAQVWGSPNGPVWAYHPFPRAVALEIARIADENDWELSTTVGSITYYRQRPGQALGPVSHNRIVVASNSDAIIDNPLRILTWAPEAVEAVRSLCQSKFADQCYTETYYKPDGTIQSLGVFALQANKGAALALVISRLGIQHQQVMAIGDNLNDLLMFAYARVSVAMSNSPDEVKQKADAVAPSNDQEGVAWALKEFVVCD